MSRPERWWRPAPRRNVRPAVRSARRGRYAEGQRYVDGFEVGYRAGLADDTTAAQRDQYEQLRRAADAAEQGDMGPLDDFLAVADAAGATPLGEVDGGQLVDELEAWLAEQD